jgi:C-terminal processing protease CtpA/Prc
LIIDVRANGGGDDDMWKAPLLRLLAKQPFRNGSDYVKKVIAGRAAAHEKVGEVVQGQVENWVQPDLQHPLRFEGRVSVLVGRFTYSSAVLFSNAVQDFGIGQLVGAGGTQRTRQSGGIQIVALPRTGLSLIVPRFVLTRPSGARTPELLRPDRVLPDSPFDRQQLLQALLAQDASAHAPEESR